MRAYLLSILLALCLIGVACSPVALKSNQEGNTAFVIGNYNTALRAYRQAQAEAPGMPGPVYNSGNAHYRLREFDLALEQYRQALLDADEELTQRSLYNLGNAYFKTLAFEDAIEAYKEALRLDPADQDAKHNLELALLQLQRMSPASQEEQEEQREEERQSEEEQEDEQQDEDEGGQQRPEPQQPAQTEPQPPQAQPRQTEVPTLTEQQARQLLESVGEGAQTLRGHLQQVYVVEKGPPANDW